MEDDAPPGVPEWVVTYGDMMSLLLTFFIMLVSLSEVVAESKFRAIMEAARQYMGYTGAPAAPPGKNCPLNSVVDSLMEMKLGSISDDDKGHGGVKQKAPPGMDLRVQRLREGESQLAGRPIYFTASEAILDPESLQEIDRIAQEVAGKPHKLEIRAFSSPFIEGLEQTIDERMSLSYQRAFLVMERLQNQRVEHKRMRIAVYFHQPEEQVNSQSIKPSDRVEVTILDEYADTYIGRDQDYR
ncbi:MAG: flagellar motor protein MotB [Planctomycetaceae bacterium]